MPAIESIRTLFVSAMLGYLPGVLMLEMLACARVLVFAVFYASLDMVAVHGFLLCTRVLMLLYVRECRANRYGDRNQYQGKVSQ